MSNFIVTVFILFWGVVLPIVVGGIFAYSFYKSNVSVIPEMIDIIMACLIGVTCGLILFGCGAWVCDVSGVLATENDDLFNSIPQHFTLNGVNYTFTDQRYIDVTIPDGFSGRISILNTETQRALFSVSIAKGEVFSKTTDAQKQYRCDTGYTGTNQITIEVETADRYESHVYTLKKYFVRPEGSGIGAPNKNAIQIEV
jgi:hypothetical protein